MRSGERDMLVKLLEQRQGLSHSKAAALIAQGAAAPSLQLGLGLALALTLPSPYPHRHPTLTATLTLSLTRCGGLVAPVRHDACPGCARSDRHDRRHALRAALAQVRARVREP